MKFFREIFLRKYQLVLYTKKELLNAVHQISSVKNFIRDIEEFVKK
jgi:hypothetical protein